MNCAIVENNIIVNVIVIPTGDDPAAWGGKELPPGKWIGDLYNSESDLEARVAAMEQAQGGDGAVYDELDAAYQEGYSEGYTEGVNGAYDQ